MLHWFNSTILITRYTLMTTIKKTLSSTVLALATASLFSFGAVAEESAVTVAQAQQIRVAAVSFENELAVMMDSMDEQNEMEIAALTQDSIKQMDVEAEMSVANSETMIAE